MSNIPKWSIVLTCLLGALPVFAQEKSLAFARADYEAYMQAGLMGFEFERSLLAPGSDELFDVWTMGKVWFKSGDTVKNIYIRYDRLADELVWRMPGGKKAAVLGKSIVEGFELSYSYYGSSARYMQKDLKLPALSGLASVYLQELLTGEYSFYAYRNLKISNQQVSLVDNTRYLVYNQGSYFYVSLRRGSLYTLPGVDKRIMREVVRRNRIRPRNDEREMAKALKLYTVMK